METWVSRPAERTVMANKTDEHADLGEGAFNIQAWEASGSYFTQWMHPCPPSLSSAQGVETRCQRFRRPWVGDRHTHIQLAFR